MDFFGPNEAGKTTTTKMLVGLLTPDSRDMVKGIVKGGQTVFFSSHLLAEVQQVCDHVTIINNGLTLFSELSKTSPPWRSPAGGWS